VRHEPSRPLLIGALFPIQPLSGRLSDQKRPAAQANDGVSWLKFGATCQRGSAFVAPAAAPTSRAVVAAATKATRRLMNEQC
jgi:hypothetical protein